MKSLIPLADAIISRTREAIKGEIAALPDGVYLTVDFEGTSPQTTRGGINSVYNFTFAYTCHAVTRPAQESDRLGGNEAAQG